MITLTLMCPGLTSFNLPDWVFMDYLAGAVNKTPQKNNSVHDRDSYDRSWITSNGCTWRIEIPDSLFLFLAIGINILHFTIVYRLRKLNYTVSTLLLFLISINDIALAALAMCSRG